MPLILAGVFTLLGVGVVNLTTKKNGDSIFTPPAQSIPNPTNSLPWYVPATVVVVGGLLLYKYGAKTLKV